ncbi:MBL fold metallo-hydrolase [Corynebacterium aquilae]|uniref:Metallo-beta-lactamase domain-containing protein n=1 Tax=Corynebacterium aquilae DSM 44791 TaxID=1431546 RepID=A0A1L7CHN7_9CORY|nr:MBL fold metallo-hydrolase [Corynebacterium aquilae]APT85348.1 hypothetical protein CAQU_10085 [Corynebacterium aquilae DSM 44791]
MKVRILGCSGSVARRGNPASGYLVTSEGMSDVVMDLGPGAFAELASVANPSDVHVLFSHLHPDHCMDFPSLLVWRRFHPQRPSTGRNLCYGPEATFRHLGRLSADHPDEIDDMSDTFAFTPWRHGEKVMVDRLFATPFRVVHPIETFALRLEEPKTGKVLAFSGDSAVTDALVDAARGADVFLCEATWGDSSAGKPPAMHLSGAEAGAIAQEAGVKTLVLVHIPPWTDPADAVNAARSTFDGEIIVGESGTVIEF